MYVYLIGAGPGDPGLLTCKGRKVLSEADVVVYDYLASDELLSIARPDAEFIYVGKIAGNHAMKQGDINKLLSQIAGVEYQNRLPNASELISAGTAVSYEITETAVTYLGNNLVSVRFSVKLAVTSFEDEQSKRDKKQCDYDNR